MTLQNILQEALKLSTEERRQLIKVLVDTLGSSEITEPLDRTLSLHLEIWESTQIQSGTNQQADEREQTA